MLCKTYVYRAHLWANMVLWSASYSQILCVSVGGGGGLPKILDFGCFVLICWQTDTCRKQEILKQSCKNLFIWTELPINCDPFSQMRLFCAQGQNWVLVILFLYNFPFIVMVEILKLDNPKWSYAHVTLGYWKVWNEEIGFWGLSLDQ